MNQQVHSIDRDQRTQRRSQLDPLADGNGNQRRKQHVQASNKPSLGGSGEAHAVGLQPEDDNQHESEPDAIQHAAPGNGDSLGANNDEHHQTGERKAQPHQRAHRETAVEHDACRRKAETPYRRHQRDDEHCRGVGDSRRIGPRIHLAGTRKRLPLRAVAGRSQEVIAVLRLHSAGPRCAQDDSKRCEESYRVGLLLSISPFTRSTNASVLTEPSARSCPRTRTFTSPASISLSPTTSWNGTFCIACSRIFAVIFSLRTSTCTRTPAAFNLSPTSFAYAWCFSPIGTTTTCVGESHTGNAPAYCSMSTPKKRSTEP